MRDGTQADGNRGRGTGTLLVDGHAHFHASFSPARFLEALRASIRRWAPDPDGPGDVRLCLLLAEPGDGDPLERLCDAVSDVPGWELRETGEAVSRVAVGPDGPGVCLVAGRQTATAEGLEVLSLVTAARLRRGRPLLETVRASLEEGAATVLPWGFGKWWFGRGRIARSVVERVEAPLFFLGDNGGRLGLAPEPRLFRLARERGTAVLAGSDPLPFPRAAERVGSYGSILSDVDLEGAPAARLLERLRHLRPPVPTFGRRAAPGRFLVDQVGMQIRNRGRP